MEIAIVLDVAGRSVARKFCFIDEPGELGPPGVRQVTDFKETHLKSKFCAAGWYGRVGTR